MVFIPIMFMAGILGRVLNEMAVTITLCILVSGFVTLSLTPMLCSGFIEARFRNRGTFPIHRTPTERSLHFALRFRGSVMLVSMGILVLTLWLFTVVPTGFIPATDSGIFYAFGMAEQSASFETMKERVLKAGRVFMTRTFSSSLVSSASAAPTSMNNVAMFPLLKPWTSASAAPSRSLTTFVRNWPRCRICSCSCYNPPSIQIGGKQTKALYQFTLLSLTPANSTPRPGKWLRPCGNCPK